MATIGVLLKMTRASASTEWKRRVGLAIQGIFAEVEDPTTVENIDDNDIFRPNFLEAVVKQKVLDVLGEKVLDVLGVGGESGTNYAQILLNAGLAFAFRISMANEFLLTDASLQDLTVFQTDADAGANVEAVGADAGGEAVGSESQI